MSKRKISPTKKRLSPRQERVAALFREKTVLRTHEVLGAGIHPRDLYAMRDAGTIRQIGRGLYQLEEADPLSNPDFVMIAKRVPKGVICLISALSFHGLTTQVPHAVYIAIPRGTRLPRLDFPPIRVYRMSTDTISQGIETHEMDGIKIRIFSPEKTIADCFKYRRSIGVDTAIEALRTYRARGKANVGELLCYAEVCQVGTVMMPYLEAII